MSSSLAAYSKSHHLAVTPPGRGCKNKTQDTWAQTPFYLVCEKGHTADISQGLHSLEIHYSSDGAHPRTHAAPVTVRPVLAGPQVEMPACVVGLLINKPMTIHHVAGMEVGHVEMVHEVGAIVLKLHHPATHVLALIEPHFEGPTMLMDKEQEVKAECLILD